MPHRCEMVRAIPLLLGVVLVTGCGAWPWVDYGEPPQVCVPVFAPEAKLEWAGRGDPVSLGLFDPQVDDAEFGVMPRVVGDIYVGRASPEQVGAPGPRAYCYVSENAVFAGPVPGDWFPP